MREPRFLKELRLERRLLPRELAELRDWAERFGPRLDGD
jgi:hypothetical protein